MRGVLAGQGWHGLKKDRMSEGLKPSYSTIHNSTGRESGAHRHEAIS